MQYNHYSVITEGTCCFGEDFCPAQVRCGHVLRCVHGAVRPSLFAFPATEAPSLPGAPLALSAPSSRAPDATAAGPGHERPRATQPLLPPAGARGRPAAAVAGARRRGADCGARARPAGSEQEAPGSPRRAERRPPRGPCGEEQGPATRGRSALLRALPVFKRTA